MKSETLKTLEERYKVTLSQKYKQWYLNTDLSTCFVGSDIAPSYIYELTDWASKTLRKANIDFTLPKNASVFFMHQGYEFCFFECNGDDDPPVWIFNEYDTRMPEVRWQSFSAYLAYWFSSDADEITSDN